MNKDILFDGLYLFMCEDDSSKFSMDILKYLNSFFDFSILTDTFISADKRNKIINLLGNDSCLLESFIERSDYNLSDLDTILKNNQFKYFTCFNNGMCIPSLAQTNINKYKSISFLYSLYPLFEEKISNKEYKTRFKKTVINRNNLSYKTFVFSEFHYNLAINLGINKNLLEIVYPVISHIYTPINTLISESYTKSKFDLNSDYFIIIGSIDESFNLKTALDFFYKFKKLNHLAKLVIIPYNSNFKLKEKDEDIVVLKDLTSIDENNLLNNSLALIDYSSPYTFNLSKIKALFTHTLIVTDLNQLNLEYFEDYPIYEIDDAIELLLHKKKLPIKENLVALKEKFSIEKLNEKLFLTYGGDSFE